MDARSGDRRGDLAGRNNPPSDAEIAAQLAVPEAHVVRKADIYARATDVEAEAIDAAVSAAGAKLRGLWNANLEFRSDSPYWPQIAAMGEQLFGGARASQLLAPSGS